MAIASTFVPTLLLSFAATLLLAGLFGAYFGKGRSRTLGLSLNLVALLLLALFCALTWELVPGLHPVFDPATVALSLVAVLAATLGSLAAVALFVAAVMRS